MHPQKQAAKAPGSHPLAEFVKSVTQDDFLKFIAAPYAIIMAGDGATPDDFPVAVTLPLGLFHLPPVSLGAVDLKSLELTPFAKVYIRAQLSTLNLQPDSQGRPPTGFYLFGNTKLLAFDTGQLDINKDGNAFGWSIATGLLAGLTKSPELAQLSTQLLRWNAGERVVESFKQKIQEHYASWSRASEAQLPSRDWEDDALKRAYATLGLPPTASANEVAFAHRKLVKENHPDRAGSSAAEQERATQRTAEVNAARDFILKQRP